MGGRKARPYATYSINRQVRVSRTFATPSRLVLRSGTGPPSSSRSGRRDAFDATGDGTSTSSGLPSAQATIIVS